MINFYICNLEVKKLMIVMYEELVKRDSFFKIISENKDYIVYFVL